MTSRTHDLIAFGSLLTVAAYYPPESLNISTVFACVIGNIIGSLAPDLDQATNRLWDMLPAGNTIGKIFRNLLIHHRTISHSLLGIYIFYLLLLFLIPKILNPVYINTSYVLISIMIGFITHIAADVLTKDGIPPPFPHPRQNRRTSGKNIKDQNRQFRGKIYLISGYFGLHRLSGSREKRGISCPGQINTYLNYLLSKNQQSSQICPGRPAGHKNKGIGCIIIF